MYPTPPTVVPGSDLRHPRSRGPQCPPGHCTDEPRRPLISISPTDFAQVVREDIGGSRTFRPVNHQDSFQRQGQAGLSAAIRGSFHSLILAQKYTGDGLGAEADLLGYARHVVRDHD